MRYFVSAAAAILTCAFLASPAVRAAENAETKAPAAAKASDAKVPEAKAPAAAREKSKVELKSDQEKVNYIIGMSQGNGIKNQFQQMGLDLNGDIVGAAVADAIAGREPPMTQEEMQKTFEAFKQTMQAKQAEKMKATQEEAQKNKAAGKAFLDENAKKEGVKVLPSGLQYKVIQEGTGATPKATDTVTANYRGTLIDGTEFDSSEKHGGPAPFPVTGVIPGWTEALQLMKEGSKWQLFIPVELAYGDRSNGPIAAGSTLIFDIELVKVVKEAPAGAPADTKPAAAKPAKSE